MNNDFNKLVCVWENDAKNATTLCDFICDMIEEGGNYDYTSLPLSKTYSLFINPNEQVESALANSQHDDPNVIFSPILLDGVVADVFCTKSEEIILVTLVDKSVFGKCASTPSGRIQFIKEHLDLIDNVVQVFVPNPNFTIGHIANVPLGTVVHVALGDVGCNANANAIMGFGADISEDEGDLHYFGEDGKLHGAYDYYYKYNEIRLSLENAYNLKYGKSSNESLIDGIANMISEIRDADREEKHQAYLKNKSLIDSSKTREDYERLQEEAAQQHREMNKNYVDLLDHYISNGTEEEKIHASALKKDESLSAWLYIFLFITGCGAFAAITGATHVITVVIWVGLFIANIVYLVRVKKNAKLAKEFFANNDESVIDLHDKSEKSFENSLQAKRQFETYQKVEKYEKRNNIK